MSLALVGSLVIPEPVVTATWRWPALSRVAPARVAGTLRRLPTTGHARHPLACRVRARVWRARSANPY